MGYQTIDTFDSTRKMPRRLTNEDLIIILLCTSDSYMPSIRKKQTTIFVDLDEEAKQLPEYSKQGYLEEICAENISFISKRGFQSQTACNKKLFCK